MCGMRHFHVHVQVQQADRGCAHARAGKGPQLDADKEMLDADKEMLRRGAQCCVAARARRRRARAGAGRRAGRGGPRQRQPPALVPGAVHARAQRHHRAAGAAWYVGMRCLSAGAACLWAFVRELRVRAASGERWLRCRCGRRACRAQVQIPVCVFVFDLLAVDGEDLLAAPLRARRARLAAALPAMRAGYCEAARCWELPAPPALPPPRAPGEAGARAEAAASPGAPAAPGGTPPTAAEDAAPKRRTRARAAGAAAAGAAAGAAPPAGVRGDADAGAAPAAGAPGDADAGAAPLGAATAEAAAAVAEAAEGEAAAGGEGAEGAAGAEVGREARVRELLQEALAAGTEARPSQGCCVSLCFQATESIAFSCKRRVHEDGVTQQGPS